MICFFCQCGVGDDGVRLDKHHTARVPSLVCAGSGKTLAAMQAIHEKEAKEVRDGTVL